MQANWVLMRITKKKKENFTNSALSLHGILMTQRLLREKKAQ